MSKKTIINEKEKSQLPVRTKAEKTGNSTKKREMDLVTTSKKYWSPKVEGDSVEGIFLRVDRIEGSKYGALEPSLKDPKKKVKTSYQGVLADEETGEEITLPSMDVLNKFFQGDSEKDIKPCSEGRFVRFTFTGKKLKKDKKVGSTISTDYYNNFIIEAEKEAEVKTKKK